jgi:hypothetical protein
MKVRTSRGYRKKGGMWGQRSGGGSKSDGSKYDSSRTQSSAQDSDIHVEGGILVV